MKDKLERAIAFLRSRNRYVLDLRHDRQRWKRQMDQLPEVVVNPKVRKIR